MFHTAEEYEDRAAECERLSHATADPVLREEILSLGRIYRDYASHLRGRAPDETIVQDMRRVANE